MSFARTVTARCCNVDKLITQVTAALTATGRLDNTFIFVLSDNGWHKGEHSIPAGKGTAYKEVLSPPMWVRGPSVRPGRTDTRLAGMHDIAPTLLTLAGERPPAWMDGRQLRPLLYGNFAAPWRDVILAENWQDYEWQAVLSEQWKLVVWRHSTELELYDTINDPFEQNNLADDPGYEAQKKALRSRLQSLKACVGSAQCKAAETRP